MNSFLQQTEVRRQLSRSSMYKLLAKAFLYPTEDLVDGLFHRSQADVLSSFLTLGDQSQEMEGALQFFRELLSSRTWVERRPELEQEYNRLFAHLGSAKCPPYETEYGYDNIFQKTEAMGDIAGFYRAFGLEVSEDNAERVDFIAMELEFMSFLAMKESYAIEQHESEHFEVCRDAERKFLQDHLGRWTKIFASILLNSTSNPFYSQLGNLLAQFVTADTRILGVEPKEVTSRLEAAQSVNEPLGCNGCSMEPQERQPS